MRAKQLIILLSLVVLLGTALAVKQMRPKGEVYTEEYADIGVSFAPADISKISIDIGAGRDKAITLAGSDKGWVVESFYGTRAKGNDIESLMASLSSLKGELRSSSEDALPDFRIDDNVGTHIELEGSGAARCHFVIGMKRAGPGGAFIRAADSNKVYFVKDDLLSKAGIWGEPETAELKGDYFCDRSIVSFDEDKVLSFAIMNLEGGQAVELCNVKSTLEEGADKRRWSFVREGLPFEIDAAKIRDFLKSIESKSASEIVGINSGTDYGFDSPRWEITIEIDGGEPVSIITGNFKDEARGMRYMQAKGAPVALTVSKNVADSINVDDSYFFADNPLKIDDTLSELTIHTGKAKKKYVGVEKETAQEGAVPAEVAGGETLPAPNAPVAPDVAGKNAAKGERHWFIEGGEEQADAAVNPVVDALRRLKAERLLLAEGERALVPEGKNDWVILKTADKEVIIDAGKLIEGAKKEYPAKLRGTEVGFAISEGAHKAIFGE